MSLTILWEAMSYNGKRIRLTESQKRHIAFFHPEALVDENKLKGTINSPDMVTEGGGPKVRVLYKLYASTPASEKHLAVVVKEFNQEGFIVTSYFTDRVRRLRVLWKRASS
jgi:hypothetical protein